MISFTIFEIRKCIRTERIIAFPPKRKTHSDLQFIWYKYLSKTLSDMALQNNQMIEDNWTHYTFLSVEETPSWFQPKKPNDVNYFLWVNCLPNE